MPIPKSNGLGSFARSTCRDLSLRRGRRPHSTRQSRPLNASRLLHYSCIRPRIEHWSPSRRASRVDVLDVRALDASTSESTVRARRDVSERLASTLDASRLVHSTTATCLGVETRCHSKGQDSCIRPLRLAHSTSSLSLRRGRRPHSTPPDSCIRPLQLYDSLSTSVETARRVDVVNVRGRPVGFSPPTRLAVCRGVAVYRGVPRRESIADSTSSRVARALGIVEPSRGRESPSSSAPGPPRSNSPPPRWHRL